MQADEKVRRGSARKCASGLQGECRDRRELSEGLSEPMGGGETIGRRSSLSGAILEVLTELLPLTEDYLRECVKPLCMFTRSNSSV